VYLTKKIMPAKSTRVRSTASPKSEKNIPSSVPSLDLPIPISPRSSKSSVKKTPSPSKKNNVSSKKSSPVPVPVSPKNKKKAEIDSKAPSPKAKKATTAQTNDEGTTGNGKRSFKILRSSTGKVGGRYLNLSPDAAARKAGRQLFSDIKKNDPDKFDRMAQAQERHTFTLVETTRGTAACRKSAPREYAVTLKKKKNPIIVQRGDSTAIPYAYDHIIESFGVAKDGIEKPKVGRPRKKD
jgi:hypothetical protein